MRSFRLPIWLCVVVTVASLSLGSSAAPPSATDPEPGTLPTDDQGKPLNLDLETGTLKDWSANGDAFKGQPIKGDTVVARRSDMKSGHVGEYWIGSFERAGDAPQGTLTSRSFKVAKPFARFLVGGGRHAETRVEIVRKDSGGVLFKANGDDTEELKPIVVDLTPHMGKEIFIRLVDQHSGGWGHISFDDFRFFATRPSVPSREQTLIPDTYAHDGLSPNGAAAAMTLPSGFTATLFAGEPDVVQPIAQAIDDRGRLWVAEAYSYPIRVPENQAKDRILIFEDKDGDGVFDTRKVFTDKLNLVSALEVGFGGVWVGAAPNFLFIPDKDGDDLPDGPPQVLLDGWHYEDTHETLNSFAWGPDGWLYGCHGVFTHSRVGKPGTPDKERTPINAGIWRYHPIKHVFEVFANGTSNPWGVDFDEHGQAVLTSCVIPHLYHIIQNGRYERQAGSHFNPFTYDDIKTIADHRHYLGANPHGGNGKSDSAGGGHAHAGAMIYLGGAWPAEYRGSIFMNNIHGARLNRDLLVRKGSGLVGRHAADFLLANDRWSQIINLQYGPDGSMFLIDWYDKNQCHHFDVNGHDRTNGRVFKIAYGSPKPVRVDLAALSTPELVALQTNANEWYARHARRILQERGPNPQASMLLKGMLADQKDEIVRLRALWALHAVGEQVDWSRIDSRIEKNEYVRAWTIQLGLENGAGAGAGSGAGADSAPVDRLAAMARDDVSPVVRLYLSSAAQRIKPAKTWGIVAGLVRHGEDSGDHNLPLMDWYAAEPLAALDASRALDLAIGSRIPIVLPFMARRIGAIGTPESIALLVEGLGKSNDPVVQRSILEGLSESLKGLRTVAMPKGWPLVSRKLAASADTQVRSLGMALALTFGDPAALASLRALLIDPKTEGNQRRDALASLLKAHDPQLAGPLQALLDDSTMRAQSLRALAAYDDAKTADAILARYSSFTPDERRDALNTLAARLDYAHKLLSAVGENKVPAQQLTADVIRQLRNHKNKSLDEQIVKFWGMVRETAADKAKQIGDYKKVIILKPARPADPSLGRAVFAKTCQQCHTLFGAGGKVGPEITGSNRADLDYILSNVLDPSALIGKDYQAHVVATTDGRVLTGIVRSEDPNSITIVSANDVITIPKSEIEERKLSNESMMPADLWKPLSEHEVRSLVAYLASPAQTPMLATAENCSAFFNGKDLSGWVGDPTLWKVENGEIVGKTLGVKRNEFLISELAADDFRLSLDVKLFGNEGNSGVQFRSEALPNGEMRGDQADIGSGWWGKLYEENARGLLWDHSGEEFVKQGEWNHYEIIAIGSRIQTFLNGKLCVNLDDPSGMKRGVFAFQLHSGGPTQVRFKNIKLEINPKLETAAKTNPN